MIFFDKWNEEREKKQHTQYVKDIFASYVKHFRLEEKTSDYRICKDSIEIFHIPHFSLKRKRKKNSSNVSTRRNSSSSPAINTHIFLSPNQLPFRSNIPDIGYNENVDVQRW